MTEEDIQRFKEQAKVAGYQRSYGKSNSYYRYFNDNNWSVELTITPYTHPDTYKVEAVLHRVTTRHMREFITGHEDIIGPIDHWAKGLIAFNEFMYK